MEDCLKRRRETGSSGRVSPSVVMSKCTYTDSNKGRGFPEFVLSLLSPCHFLLCVWASFLLFRHETLCVWTLIIVENRIADKDTNVVISTSGGVAIDIEKKKKIKDQLLSLFVDKTSSLTSDMNKQNKNREMPCNRWAKD